MIEVDVRKQVGGFHLEASFAAGEETVVLFGHSGSGKSMTLRCIAGLARPDSGRIALGGRPVFDATTKLDEPPQRRMVGYVPQNLALFPHLTARENIEYGLVGMSKDQRRTRSSELVELLELDGLGEHLPSQLSGGQQQRVALARALAPGARVLLLDEPFSALDSSLRRTLRRELLHLKEQLALTVIFVTHDLAEAYNVADQMVVYDAGRTIDSGHRERIYSAPAGRRVAELIEYGNILSGIVMPGEVGLRVELGGLAVHASGDPLPAGTPVAVAIRPEQVLLLRHEGGAGPGETHVFGRIVDDVDHGKSHTLVFRTDGGLRLEAEVPARPYEVLDVANHREWWLGLRRENLHVMVDD